MFPADGFGSGGESQHTSLAAGHRRATDARRTSNKTASNIMTPGPACCATDTPLDAVAKLMVQHNCGEIPVVDADGQLLGVVTDRDIVSRVLATGKNPLDHTAQDCMSQSAVTVYADTTLTEVWPRWSAIRSDACPGWATMTGAWASLGRRISHGLVSRQRWRFSCGMSRVTRISPRVSGAGQTGVVVGSPGDRQIPAAENHLGARPIACRNVVARPMHEVLGLFITLRDERFPEQGNRLPTDRDRRSALVQLDDDTSVNTPGSESTTDDSTPKRIGRHVGHDCIR